MKNTSLKLTVFFEDPFWVGVFEQVSQGGKLSACKVTFGAEPKDTEVLDFLINNFDALKFGPSVKVDIKPPSDNPKRRQRDAKKQLLLTGIGTKSQQALKIQHELLKSQANLITRKHRLDDKQRHFELKQLKRREKHKGH